jgi:hypothetical protein
MTNKQKTNYYSHLGGDHSDTSIDMGKEKKPKPSIGHGTRTVLPSTSTTTYNTRSKGTNAKPAKNISLVTTINQEQEAIRSRLTPKANSLVHQVETENLQEIETENQDKPQDKAVKIGNYQEYEVEMVSRIIQYFANYLQTNPTDKYSMFLRKCFPSGFSQVTDLLSLRKSVNNVFDNNRLLMILRKLEALKNYMKFTIDPDKQLLYELTQLAMNELDQKSDMLYHKMTTTEDLEVFHSKIFSHMKHWAFKNQSDFYADMWIDAVEKGLHHYMESH